MRVKQSQGSSKKRHRRDNCGSHDTDMREQHAQNQSACVPLINITLPHTTSQHTSHQLTCSTFISPRASRTEPSSHSCERVTQHEWWDEDISVVRR